MASKVTLLSLCMLLIIAWTQARGNLNMGSPLGAHLIHYESHEKNALPLIKREEEVVVSGVGNEIVRAVIVQDLKGDGESYVKRGGVGRNNVTIKLKGPRGGGYKFLVQVYAA
ncbi:hypothetical protein EVAR_25941_1 [Eumeta japonica]|uniref:Salivary secreted peptide n=1 Tax=Eumeta variegata TaxID=151549 RepID=A0A4C1V2U0_EUMVA|nr:hypothetical protein EVAR_25941_1 [Eumeta japonica]